MVVHDNEKLVRSIYDSFNARAFDRIESLVADDVEQVNVPLNTRYRGRREYMRFIQEWARAFDDCKVEIIDITAGEEGTVTEFIARGTHTGPLVSPTGNIPPTGKKMSVQFCEVHRIRDGKIATAHVYYDSATLLRQLGLVPEVNTGGNAGGSTGGNGERKNRTTQPHGSARR